MNNISTITKCYGCSACLNICPNNAIEMIENDEGFKFPQINLNCTNCGLCKNVCPSIMNESKNSSEPTCYAFLANDEIRKESTSGAVFPVLAKYFLENDGYVAGAVWKEDATVHHIISNKYDDIELMRNSKYLQSNIDSCYSQIKTLLKNNKKVLFTGTPCQVAGLKCFLQKEYNNLYCVDIICHGVPSPKVFRKYINEKIKNKDEKWVNTNFRDKCNGWRPQLTTTTTTTTLAAQNDAFMKGFLSNLFLRKTCTECKFQTIPRQGDLTIGDFWGIWNFDKNLNDEKGTSVVLENTIKGHLLINILQKSAKMFKEVPLKYAKDGNPCLTHPSIIHGARNLFFENFDKYKLNDIVEICDKDKVDYVIVNFWHTINYGASLTAWALQELLKEFGLTSLLLDRDSGWDNTLYAKSFSKTFAEQYLNVSHHYDKCELKELSKNIKGVILGSDQMLRLEYIKEYLYKYLLNWVDTDTKKIALSASFGIEKQEFINYKKFTPKVAKYMKSALQSFDYLSCREFSGKEIFKDVFGLSSDQILDPVFLLPPSKYDEIIKNSNIDNSNKIVCYVLDENEDYQKIYNNISQKTHTEVVSINNNCLVEDWLKSVKEAKFIITDSFHGVCFALIFNKPFICVQNKKRGQARFKSLISLFDIEENFINSVDEFFSKDISLNTNYSKINKLIKSKAIADRKKVEDVLKHNYSNNPNAKQNKIKNEKLIKEYHEIKFYKKLPLLLNYTRCKILINFTKKHRKEHYIHKKNMIKQKLKNGIEEW